MTLSEQSHHGVQYYEDNAKAFSRKVAGREPVPGATWLAERFSGRECTSVLVDAGCGVGTDTRYLRFLGFRVHAFDASDSMIAEARAADPDGVYLVHRHDQLALADKADGILASASLIFLSDEDLVAALEAFARNLKSDGRVMAAFKHGRASVQSDDGRVYRHLSEGDLAWLTSLSPLVALEARITPDSLGRGNDWITFEMGLP